MRRLQTCLLQTRVLQTRLLQKQRRLGGGVRSSRPGAHPSLGASESKSEEGAGPDSVRLRASVAPRLRISSLHGRLYGAFTGPA